MMSTPFPRARGRRAVPCTSCAQPPAHAAGGGGAPASRAPGGASAWRPARVALLALAVAACSTPPDYFHTLRPTGPAVSPAAQVPGGVLAIGPVTVPDSLARNEWVIRVGDTGALVYDHQLWTQGLASEIAQSLADHLNRAPLPGALWADAGPTGSGSAADLDVAPALRVRVQVLRFDSMLAPAPAIDDQVRWTLECLPSDTALSPVEAGRFHAVRTGVRDAGTDAPPVNPTVDAAQQRFDRLARAHAQTLRAVAADVVAALRDTAADRARDCVRAAGQ